MDCSFCEEFAQPGAGPRVITEQEGWVLLPTLGCFTTGYCLFMPIDHVSAVADFPPHALSKLELNVERMRSLVEAEFGSAIIAEHGPRPGTKGCDLGAGCCTHAHLHIVPVLDDRIDDVARVYERTGGVATRPSSLMELADVVSDAYVYLSPRPGEHLVWPAHGFARQFVRRVCADLSGRPEEYDWRDHPFAQHMRITRTRLRANLALTGMAVPAPG